MDNLMPNHHKGTFGDPFQTHSNALRPKTVKEMFDWASYMWNHFGVYAQAIRNSVRYFVTDIEVFPRPNEPVGFESRENYRNLLRGIYGILDTVAKVGEERIAFGNSFTSVVQSFRRELVCPVCSFMGPMDQFKWKMERKQVKGDCPKCKSVDKVMRVEDLPSHSDDGGQASCKVIHWDARNILIDHCPVSGRSEYWLRAPAEWRKKLETASSDAPIFMEDLPWEMVEAIINGDDFKFDREWFHHSKIDPPSSFSNDLNGWGVPLFMPCFEQALLLQTLDRYNEAIIRDYLIPFRVISPPPQAAGGDPMRMGNMGEWKRNLGKMIEEHRRDPATWHTIPFPLQYQALGGEGTQLTTVDLKNQALQELLASMGIPGEFYQTTLGLQANPIGIRYFERVWAHHVRPLDEWLDWYVGCCHKMLGWERVTAELTLTSVHEDDNIVGIKLDLAAAGKVSMRTAFEAVNLNPDLEKLRIQDEMDEEEILAKKRQREMERGEDIGMQLQSPPPMTVQTAEGLLMEEQQAAGGPPPGGGMMPPAGGGGGAPAAASIDELLMQAEEMAMEIMVMDSTTRKSTLINLSKNNPELHAQVKAMLDKMENQAATQGKMMAREGQM